MKTGPAPASVPRTVAASVIGTVAEYYDFFIYGTASALVFNKVFFPSVSPLLGTLAAFSTYAVGFFARPLGGIVWGHIGDRVGRRQTLVYTLLLTGLGTVAVGLMPGYAQIGFWSPVFLVLVRLIQGFGVGGEQGGAVLLAAEVAPPGKRGFVTSFVQLGSPAAYLIPSALFAVLDANMSEATFVSWGWRIPFLLSLLVVLIGLYVRLRVQESETFRAVRENLDEHRAPLKTLLRDSRTEVVAGTLAKFVEAAVFPFYTVFLVSYAKSQGVDTSIVLDAVIIGIVAELVLLPLWGRLTDRVGRRPVYLAATVLNLALVVPSFLAVQTGNGVVITVLLVAGLAFGHGGAYAPQASFFPELFPSDARYSGVSIVWQFGSMIASGPFTVVAAALLAASDGGFGLVAVYVGALVLISLIALRWLPETAPRRLGGREYADWPRPAEEILRNAST
ncbi:MHS family MFS transporter [Amycolatopsis acidicola]|uniref:Putative proline/betaine transporter n=1 Tax=Amycolatopsis acidicola TaxID=2596893 RepID=A0A5N0UGN6_9PSEU|nr:MFS transporter [Amycolatopsis acidicola]KAA9147637.1 MHS family MFS transporter [Amycolatopsis acidicola]